MYIHIHVQYRKLIKMLNNMEVFSHLIKWEGKLKKIVILFFLLHEEKNI